MPIPPPLRSLLRTTPTLAPIPNRAVLSVSGHDATHFLNGLLARTVVGNQSYAAFLHAQGRVLHDLFLFTSPSHTYLIDYGPSTSESPSLISSLQKFVLRSKVRIRDVSEEWDVWAAWGDHPQHEQRSWDWAASGAIEPVWRDSPEWPWGTQHGVIRDRRAPGMGQRLLVRKGDRPQQAATLDVLGSDAYLLHRIMHGVPEGSADIQPLHSLPMESNLDVMGGLDFRKGCYVGQELTVRTYHTGVIRKRILPVTLSLSTTSTNATPSLSLNIPIKPSVIAPPSTSIQSESDGSALRTPRLRGTSTLLSSIATPSINLGTAVGLALLRLEHLRPDVALFTDETSSEDGAKWRAKHWWPDWWPEQPQGEEGADTSSVD